MILTKKVEAGIKQVLDDYWNSYFNGDLDHWATYLVDDYRNIGGTEEEIWNSKKEILDYTHRIIDQMKGVSEIRNKQTQIIPYDPYVMVHELMDIYIKIQDEWAFYQKFRLSSLIQQQADGWKVLHQHGSYPDSKTQDGEAFAFDTIQNENLKLQQAIKARTIELEQKNRELEIEAATEKVRVQSMAMQKPGDLENVNKELHTQLTKLEIPGLSGVSFYFVDPDEIVTVWDLSSPGNMNDPNSYSFKFDSKKYPLMGEFVGILKSTKEEYFVLDFPKDKLLQGVEELKDIDIHISNIFKNAVESGALLHQWNPAARITDGILSIDLMKPPTDDTKTIVLKMAGAFNQAYTRFLDLQKAEAQVREAQIEMALEKVRSRTMAMHKSEELAEAATLVFKQFNSLGLLPEGSRVFFSLIDEDTVTSEVWTTKEDGVLRPGNHRISLKANKHLKDVYKSWKARKSIYNSELTGSVLTDYLKYIASVPNLKEDKTIQQIVISPPDRLVFTEAFFTQGTIGVVGVIPLSQESQNTLMRFSKVFEQTYTRFLDLQKAEAQTREAQIEGALERVRSRTMAMQKSEELKEVIQVVYDQFVHLNIHVEHTGFVMDYKTRDDYYIWIADHNGAPSQVVISYFDSVYYNRFNEAKEKGEDFFTTNLSFEEKNRFYKKLFEYVPGLPEEARKFYFSCPGLAASTVLLENVGLYIENFEGIPFTDEENNILMRFGKVFQQTYTRFLDLQKAEAQAREAQIETALEKVRSQSMAMHNSNELKEVITVVMLQFRHLGFDVDMANFNFFSKSKDWTLWLATADYTYPEIIHLPYIKNPLFDRPFETVKAGLNFMSDILSVEEKNAIKTHLYNSDILNSPEHAGIRKSFEDGKGYARSIIFMKSISLTIGNFAAVPYTDEQNSILKRFALVFEQSYTRFLDLQKAEAQTREAQIELALERVRARAMAMHSSTELREVVQVLFEKLREMDFVFEDGAVSILVFKEGSRDHSQWSAGPGQDYATAFEVPDTNHSIPASLMQARESGVDFFSKIFPVEEKNDYFQYLFLHTNYRHLPDVIKKLILGSKHYGYSVAFAEKSAILIPTNTGRLVSEDKKETLKRFANVFDQAFIRFLDLQKAEAQAREAQIELALERVRARAMAMQKSDELADAAQLLYNEFGNLSINTVSCGYMFIDEAKQTQTGWAVLPDGSLLPNFIVFPLTGDPVLDSRYKDWKEKIELHTYEIQGEANKEHHQFLSQYVPIYVVEEIFAKLPDRIVFHCANFSDGYLFILATEFLNKEDQQTIIRFSKVFQQTYTRFLDLQKAEAQAREAQIELGLERVRARAMAMQKSDELKELIGTVSLELSKLHLDLDRCFIMIFDPETLGVTWWMSNPEEPSNPRGLFVKNHNHPPHIAYLKGWKERQLKWEYILEGKDKKSWDDFLFVETELSQLPEFVITNMKSKGKVYLSGSFNNFGCLNLATLEPLSDDHFDIMLRFAKVFDLTYTRFNDLQKAEAQVREAEIELALERVRARTMAMQRSEELVDVATVLFQQVKALGVPQWNCGFNIWNIGDNEFTYYPGSPDGIISPSPCKIPLTEHPVFMRFDESRKRGDELLVFEKEGEEQADHYRYMLSLPGVGDLLQSMLDAGFELPKFQIDHLANFAYGNLIFITYEHFPKMHDVFKRFAKVFEQTYTRFLDLQKAEAQAREAQIELALERVRARSMAMQHSEELQDTSLILFQQLKELGEPAEQCTIGIIKELQGVVEISATLHGNKMQQTFRHKIDEPFVMSKMFRSWKDQQKTLVLEIKEEELQKYNQYRNELVGKETFPVKLLPGDRWIIHIAYFSKGMMALSTNEPRPAESLQLLERFAKVFEQTYIRFLDLQKAEAQTREAQINLAVERVRARALAMYKSEEILELVFKLKQEMMNLDIPNVVAATIHLKDKDGNYTMWDLTAMEATEGKLHQPMVVQYRLEELDPNLFIKRMWDNTAPYFLVVQDEEGFKRTLQFLRDHGRTKEAEETEAFLKIAGTKHAYHPTIPLHNGRMCIDLLEPPSDEIELILTKMGGAFDLAYKRFEDLKNSEAQLREAQIEGALEKVRSRTMGMQQSYELGDVATVLFKELNQLVDNLWTCGFVLCEKDRGEDEWWLSTGDGFIPAFYLPNTGDVTHSNIYDAWKKGETYHTEQLEGKALQQHYDWLMNVPVSKKIFEDMLAAGFTLPSWQKLHCAYFSYGYLVMITQVPCAEEQIFKRFAQVFDQTYTRFLDLQKAEFQTRQAKIETALEKVRARALAMQLPEELIDVAQVLRHEMGLLGVEELETCSIYIHDEKINRTECWYALKDIRSEEKKIVSDHFPLNLHDTWVGREMEKFYGTNAKQVSIVMQGAHRKEWINYCEEKSIPFRGYYGPVIPDRTYHLYKFSHGAIGAASAGNISAESWDLLQRAASVFSLAYSRFKDLTQARFDLHRLKEEKQRAETALTELQTTQKQLIQSEKMASLGELTAGIAHEIQNPLNFVNNFSEVSKEMLDEMRDAIEKGDTEEAKEIMNDVIQNLEKINHHGKRADGIVKGMLQHSGSGSGKKEPTDINKLGDEYLRLAYHGLRAKDKSFNATMKTDFDESIGNINIIPQDIGRVILNLINNSFYAVTEKKKQVGEGYEPTVSVSTKKVNDKVEISVKDNGNGIPQNVLDKVFQPFFTTKPTGQGTGLGLSLSYDIVKAHGGELRVETNESEGSVFTIQISII